ncbi:hypothetical protein [Nostoc sp.]|uniref:hypothetical protein n=1 Tax=Nostoc sp. TaxID=1180 RepID=UPI002FFA6336
MELLDDCIVGTDTSKIFRIMGFTILLLSEGLYEEKEFSGSQQIVSVTFPEIALTVEQVLSASNVG